MEQRKKSLLRSSPMMGPSSEAKVYHPATNLQPSLPPISEPVPVEPLETPKIAGMFVAKRVQRKTIQDLKEIKTRIA
ncbi:jg5849 [Pararge aegeria aegeria]|uniref:Jg5849 protein n=1 Tax=Pararge aegeria aegeria TaxID=348720 RepID=A0A8S4SIN3_9NEOP|nr:jg5849 [Pararge aegeria aegeria]